MNPLFLPLLKEAAQQALNTQEERVASFDHEGKSYLAKRKITQKRTYLQARLLQVLVRCLTGKWMPLTSFSLRSDLHFEITRLFAMQKEGVLVPEVLFSSDAFFVMPHCGEVASARLEHLPPEISEPFCLRLTEELADFHRKGLWHGGAQIKNITCLNEKNYRIDFEENFGEFLPRPFSQALDLMLFLNSISLVGPLDEAASRALLPSLVTCYFAKHPSEPIKACIRKVLPYVRFALLMAKPFESSSRKGIRRLSLLYAVFSQR